MLNNMVARTIRNLCTRWDLRAAIPRRLRPFGCRRSPMTPREDCPRRISMSKVIDILEYVRGLRSDVHVEMRRQLSHYDWSVLLSEMKHISIKEKIIKKAPKLSFPAFLGNFFPLSLGFFYFLYSSQVFSLHPVQARDSPHYLGRCLCMQILQGAC